jgi:hypothetical protein
VVGSAADVADVMEEWFRKEGADGFNIMASDYPEGFADFCQLVVPELRRRGLVHTAYRGTTLRDHMGLPRPAHRAPEGSTSATAMAARAGVALGAKSA